MAVAIRGKENSAEFLSILRNEAGGIIQNEGKILCL
jgi:hypothetical protein